MKPIPYRGKSNRSTQWISPRGQRRRRIRCSVIAARQEANQVWGAFKRLMRLAAGTPRRPGLIFTSDQLPPNKVVLIVKAENGQELGCVLPDEATDQQIIQIFCGIVAARGAAA